MKNLLIACLAFIAIGCQSIKPTPLLYTDLQGLNSKSIELYSNCLEEAVYVPTLPTCEPELLKSTTLETLRVAELSISKDIRQSLPYAIYLENSLIFIRTGAGANGPFYEKAEGVARQFFEVQKVSSTKSLSQATFYLVYIGAGHAAFDHIHRPERLTDERKEYLKFLVREGETAWGNLEPSRQSRLIGALQVLSRLLSQQ